MLHIYTPDKTAEQRYTGIQTECSVVLLQWCASHVSLQSVVCTASESVLWQPCSPAVIVVLFCCSGVSEW